MKRNQKESKKKMLSKQKSFFILELSAMSAISLALLYVLISKIAEAETTVLTASISALFIVFSTSIFTKYFEDGIKKILALNNLKKEI